MLRRITTRSVLLLVVVCAFATADAIVKGHHGGTRNALGNVSAPWALLPFLSGGWAMSRRLVLGALVGAASTMVALIGYSCVRAVAFGQDAQHRNFSSLAASAVTNRWFLLGALGGAVLGAAGSWLSARRQWGAMIVIVSCVLALEPAARILWAIVKDEPARTLVPSPVVWVGEILCGCALAVGFQIKSRRSET